jgi:hypothetical protein
MNNSPHQIDRHCSRLDNDLQKFEDEQLIGPGRTNITQTSASEDGGGHDRETGGKRMQVEVATTRKQLTTHILTHSSSHR